MMPISLRQSLLAALALLLCAGCSAPAPKAELTLARVAVKNAEQAGAEKMAIEEYRDALSTLQQAENEVDQGDHEDAEQTLERAIVQAHRAEVTAYVRALNLAENRIRQLEAQKTTLLKAWREAIADQEATIDFSDETESPQAQPLTSYTVTEGENLFAIAGRRKVYGDALLWPLIYKANRDQIKDPRQIYPGQRLTIPRGVSEQEMEQARSTARESTIFAAPAPGGKPR